MSLFQLGNFKLHSGAMSAFKIECEALTFMDWHALATMIAERCSFSRVTGVPRGGLPLERALRPLATEGPTLIVDDVWTTGGSMVPYLTGDSIGYVAFARGPIQHERVRALFTLDAK